MVRGQSLSSSPARSRGSFAARVARAFALLLLLVQAMVVPAHRHAAAAPSVATAGLTVAAPVKQRPDQPADCPVCREVAHAGQYLTPGDVQVAPTAASTLTPSTPTLTKLATIGHSHSWRSRAPPVFGLS